MVLGSDAVEQMLWLTTRIQKKDFYEFYSIQWIYLKDAIGTDHLYSNNIVKTL